MFSKAVPYEWLPPSDPLLKEYLNYNPHHNAYTKRQNFPGRNPGETDRGGWRGYDRVYTKYLSPLKEQRLNFLEIGVYYGYGVLAWKRYFTQSDITGVDNTLTDSIKNEFVKIHKTFPEFNDIRIEIFDTTEPTPWNRFIEKFDIIIDDGGHHPDNQFGTFGNAWPLLKKGGLYFMEDISHRYTDHKLAKIDTLLYNVHRKGNIVEIYSHENLGLKHILENPNLRKQYGIHPNAPDIHKEYIAVIEKYEE